MLVNTWQQDSDFEVTKMDRRFIEARVIRGNPMDARKERSGQIASIEAERRRIEKQMKEAQARINRQLILDEENAEKKRKLEAERRARQEAERLRAKQKLETDRLANLRKEFRETERVNMEQTMFRELESEQEYRRAVTDDEKALVYVGQIQREIIQNWSRPPSARNGMQVLLKVFLVPTGEVVEVTIKSSSGNDAFDRSAILAVKKSERFEVPSDSRQFERNFREFEVLFRPEDLRL